MSRTIPTRLLAVGAVCAVGGIGAGSVVVAGAATPAKTPTAKTKAAGLKGKGKGRRGGALQRAVALEATIPTKAGFKTVTIERGKLTKADGSTLTLTQGNKKIHRDETVTVPSGAKVMLNGAPAQLSDIPAGDRVAVITGLPKGAVVRAFTPKQKP